VVGVPETVVYYRVHGDNISSDPELMRRALFAVVQKHVGPETGDPADWPEDRQRAYSARYLHLAIEYVQRGRRVEGIGYLRRALECWPAMASRRDPYYELACVNQPWGQRGDIASLDLDEATRRVLTVLEGVYAADDLPEWVAGTRKDAYATAYLTLGILNRRRRHLATARHYLWRVVALTPARLLQRPVIVNLVRSYLDQFARAIHSIAGSRKERG
jgi:tetratricopeptide (TPR) repeat protein